MDDIQRIDSILEVLKSHAPNKRCREVCDEFVKEMRDNKRLERDIEIILAGYIYDGLKYGNWPWAMVSPNWK